MIPVLIVGCSTHSSEELTLSPRHRQNRDICSTKPIPPKITPFIKLYKLSIKVFMSLIIRWQHKFMV